MPLAPKPLADLLAKAFRFPTPSAESSALRVATAFVDWANVYLTGSMVNFVDFETPTGLVNSTDGTDNNGIFGLAHSPTGTSLLFFVDGVVQIAGTHYTLAGATVTFGAGHHPTTDSVIRACYRY